MTSEQLKLLILEISGIYQEAAEDGFAQTAFVTDPHARAATLFLVHQWAEASAAAGDAQARFLANSFAHMQYNADVEGAAAEMARTLNEILLSAEHGEGEQIEMVVPYSAAAQVVDMRHRFGIMRHALEGMLALVTPVLLGRDHAEALLPHDCAVMQYALRLGQASFDDSRQPRMVVVHKVPGSEGLALFFETMRRVRRWRDQLRHSEQTLEEHRRDLFDILRKSFTPTQPTLQQLVDQFNAYLPKYEEMTGVIAVLTPQDADVDGAGVEAAPSVEGRWLPRAREYFRDFFRDEDCLTRKVESFIELMAGDASRVEQVRDLIKNALGLSWGKMDPRVKQTVAMLERIRDQPEDNTHLVKHKQQIVAIMQHGIRMNIADPLSVLEFYYRLTFGLLDREWLGGNIRQCMKLLTNIERIRPEPFIVTALKINPSIPTENVTAFLILCDEASIPFANTLNLLTIMTELIIHLYCCDPAAEQHAQAVLAKVCQFYQQSLAEEKKSTLEDGVDHPLSKVYLARKIAADKGQDKKVELMRQTADDILWPIFTGDLLAENVGVQGRFTTRIPVVNIAMNGMTEEEVVKKFFEKQHDGEPLANRNLLRMVASLCLGVETHQFALSSGSLVDATTQTFGHVQCFSRAFDRIKDASDERGLSLVTVEFLKTCLSNIARSVYYRREKVAKLKGDATEEQLRENTNICKIYFKIAKQLLPIWFNKLRDNPNAHSEIKIIMDRMLGLRVYDLFLLSFHVLYYTFEQDRSHITNFLSLYYLEKRVMDSQVRRKGIRQVVKLPGEGRIAQHLLTDRRFDRLFSDFLISCCVDFGVSTRFQSSGSEGTEDLYKKLQQASSAAMFTSQMPIFADEATFKAAVQPAFDARKKKKKKSGAARRAKNRGAANSSKAASGSGDGGGGGCKDTASVSAASVGRSVRLSAARAAEAGATADLASQVEQVHKVST